MISAVNVIFLISFTPLSSSLSHFSSFFIPLEQRDDCDGCMHLTQKALSFGKQNLLDVCLRDHTTVPEEAFCKNNRDILL